MDKIVCVGKNYADHTKELNEVQPAKPVLFLKPPSVLRLALPDEAPLPLCIPRDGGELHHEVEIVLRLDRGGYRLDAKEAEKLIGAVTLGLDMTLRDRQAQSKKNGHPWTTSKVFPDAAVVGPWRRVSEFSAYLEEPFRLSLDGVVKQEALGTEMIYGPAECVAHASQYFPLVAGDLIFLGTPKGVGPVLPGQKASLIWGPINYNVVWRAEPA